MLAVKYNVFMPRRVFGEKKCSRCGAVAQIHSYPRAGNMVELRLDCSKCKMSKHERLTTQNYIDLLDKERKYLEMLERATSGKKRDDLLKALERVRKDKLRAEVYSG